MGFLAFSDPRPPLCAFCFHFSVLATPYKPMATPPASPPPPPPTVASKPPEVERPVVNVDPAIGKVDDPHKKKLRTYLGIVTRDKVNVTYDTWKEVPAAKKDLIWDDIKAKFDIPEASDGRTKKKVLQTVGERWRQFKSDLMRKWALAADKDSVDDTRPLLGGCAEKGTGHPEAKYRPHVLSHGGYEYLKQKLMVEETKKHWRKLLNPEALRA
ncbi:hypothetical protein GmHk_02G004772 [Glycine max]|nr:hypothetical protein GmHk_02G004772 [Glycine max]KAH1262066.1 hypothetical protein GmHk_02G004772 [Glycine max]